MPRRAMARSSQRMLKPAAQHRMQRVAVGTLEPAALHAVIVLGMPDGRLDRLTPLQPAPLAARERAALAAMDQCHPANVGIRPPVAQVDAGRVRLDAQLLQQDGGLLQFSASVWPS